MPALITHRLFGEESIERLAPGIIRSEEDRCAFLIANQGPDPFFFRFGTPNIKTCMHLAHVMHSGRISRQFELLRAGVERLPQRDAACGRAFVLGLLSHYVLDRNAHPFVYQQQWGIQETDADLAGAGGKVHAVIESDLDVLMLDRKRGATTLECPPAEELPLTERVGLIGGTLMSYVARGVYDLDVDAGEYAGAVANMRLLYRAIEPAGSPRSRALAGVEGALGTYSLLGALAHRPGADAAPSVANMEGLTWENPFTHELSRETFPQIFDRALDDYAQAAERFVEGEPLESITGHLNYSGRPLAADEEWDEEE